MSKPTQRLGRGLSTLVGSRPTAAIPPTDVTDSDRDEHTVDVPVDAIRVNPRQPRTVFDDQALEGLAESIKTHGLMQPVVVRPLGNGRYELIAGERRWRACRLAGVTSVAAAVRKCSDAEALELALVENLQREDLNPIERAMAYRTYIDEMRVTAEVLATRTAQSRANIANYLRLLNFGDEIRAMVNDGQLGMGQARAIAGISDAQRQLAVARMAVRRNLSVRQVERLATGSQPVRAKEDGASGAERHQSEVEAALSKSLGMAVKLHSGRRKNSGRVVIHYKDLEEFDRIAQRLGGKRELE